MIFFKNKIVEHYRKSTTLQFIHLYAYYINHDYQKRNTSFTLFETSG